MRPAVALGIATGCTAATALYALLRAGQVLLGNEPNPATVISSVHSGFLWRAWIAGYAGGMAALLGYWLARRDPTQVARALTVALPLAGALLVAQAVFLP
jgi:hypothetical protein